MKYKLKVTQNADGSATICLPQDVVSAYGDHLYICIGQEHSLRLYHMEQWEILQERIQAMPPEKAKAICHILYTGEIKNVQNGELVISAKFLAYAGTRDNIELIVNRTGIMIADIVAM